MRNWPKHTLQAKTILFVFAVLLLFSFTPAQPCYSSIFSYDSKPQEQSEPREKDATNISDEQAEAKSADQKIRGSAEDGSSNLQMKIPGVGASFGQMLDSLTSLTTDSEGRFKTLAANFPLIFPDLYKVFITL